LFTPLNNAKQFNGGLGLTPLRLTVARLRGARRGDMESKILKQASMRGTGVYLILDKIIKVSYI